MEFVMAFVLLALQLIVGLGSLACFIMVIIAMFKSGDSTMAIVCLVLILCLIGGLVAYIMGWVNSSKYNSQKIMLIWTGCIVAGILLNIVGAVLVR
jgi:hypothetical protein